MPILPEGDRYRSEGRAAAKQRRAESEPDEQAAAWFRRCREAHVGVQVTIPPNATATVYVPAPEISAVREGGQPIAAATGVKFLRMENDCVVLAVESGQHVFAATRR